MRPVCRLAAECHREANKRILPRVQGRRRELQCTISAGRPQLTAIGFGRQVVPALHLALLDQ
jgi:hypothetical protein